MAQTLVPSEHRSMIRYSRHFSDRHGLLSGLMSYPARIAGVCLLSSCALSCHAANRDHQADTADRNRVFFIQPRNGASVRSPVQVEFGSLNFSASPKGSLNHSGLVHHHIGLNTSCLAAGVAIPQADPWIHFAHGDTTIEMMLPKGPHRLVLQTGDHEHKALTICETLNINVVD